MTNTDGSTHQADDPEASSAAPPALSAPAPAQGSLARLFVRGAAFETIGYGVSQVIRFGSNLILTRLLYPEAFGLIALVTMLNYGLVMLSDVGIAPGVIQSPQGDDPRYLNTAWTLQVVRGLVLYVVALVLAWPLAALYGEPQLLWLILVGSAAIPITALHSTSLFTLRRRLAIGRLTLIELGSQFVTLSVILPWAYFAPSPWALLVGNIVGPGVVTITSHLLDVGYRNRLAWDPAARTSITSFGKWVFGSSMATFVGSQGDRIYLGRVLGVADLGVYSIALVMAEAAGQATMRVSYGVLFPVLSRIKLEGTDRLRRVLHRSRLGLDGVALTGLGGLIVLAPWLIRVLYDPRYEQAGWILQVLAIRVAMSSPLTAGETCLTAMGQSVWGFARSMSRMVWIVVALPLGWYSFGLVGIVWAVGLSEIPAFFVVWPALHRARLLSLWVELRAVGFCALGAGCAWLIKRAAGL